ncbi:MAG: DUF481 domain-containing protein [Spirochaetes bacterium]|nr:DUF481 domain-containing protein [Spirochaetota bacterium]
MLANKYSTALFACFAIGVFPLAADSVAETDDKPVGVLSGRMGLGFSHSYFDGTPALRQDNFLKWSDGKNSLMANSQVLGGLASADGKFNAVFRGAYDRSLLSWFELLSYVNYESNVISSMQDKVLLAAGGNAIITKSDRFLFDFSLALTYAQTRYIDAAFTRTASISLRSRMRVRLWQELKFAVAYYFVFDAYYSNDQYHSLEPTLNYPLSESSDISGGYRYRYNMLDQTYSGTIYMLVAARFKS